MWGTETAGTGDEQLRLASAKQQSWQLAEPAAAGVGGVLHPAPFLLGFQTHGHLSPLLSHGMHPHTRVSLSSTVLPLCFTLIELPLG